MQILTKIFLQTFAVSKIISIFAPRLRNDANMVTVVQLVRASDCGSIHKSTWTVQRDT